MRELIEAKKKKASGFTNMLKKLPQNTNLADLGGISFSSWDGKLALVNGSSYGDSAGLSMFDVDFMARWYHVRYALDHRGNKINAPDWAIGREPYIPGGDVPYEKSRFTIDRRPGSMGGEVIEGGFSKPYTYYVKIKLSEMYPGEVKATAEKLQGKYGFVDVSDEKLTSKDWKLALSKKTYDEAFDALYKVNWDKANKFDQFIEWKKVDWADVGGVFAVSGKQKMKFVIDRP